MQKLLAVSLMAGLGTLIGNAPEAQAYTLTSSGVFFDIEPDTAGNVSGVGTDTLSWGVPYPAGGNQSSFRFEGVNTTIPTPSIGEGWFYNFGRFTHTNNPITLAGIPITGAKLRVNFGFNDAANPLSAIFQLDYVESPNRVPCAPSTGSGICPDTVTFTFLSGDTNGTFLDGTQEVPWSVNEFFSSQPDDTGVNFDNALNPVTDPTFTTNEPGQQSAYLNGGVVSILPIFPEPAFPEPVPLETDIAGAALLAGLGYLGYRRRQDGKPSIDN